MNIDNKMYRFDAMKEKNGKKGEGLMVIGTKQNIYIGEKRENTKHKDMLILEEKCFAK